MTTLPHRSKARIALDRFHRMVIILSAVSFPFMLGVLAGILVFTRR